MVRNLPEVKLGTSLLGVSCTDTPLQGASISGLPAGGGELGHLVSGVGAICLAKKVLSGCVRQKKKKRKKKGKKKKKEKAWASKAKTGGIQQPVNASMPKQGKTLTGILKKLRSEGSTPTETARPPKRPRDSSGPGNYKEALTNTKLAIFKETYPEDKLTEHDQDNILEELGRVLHGSPIGELPHLKSYRLEGGALINKVRQ
jgi:hypothetical protein